MHKFLFYPLLTRRKKYLMKTDGSFFSNYQKYYNEIEEDCQSRCVYCDATRNELGGDKMELDHFRPQKLFPNMKNNPNNLVLSCPVCNRLKSNDWPAGKNINITFKKNIGYLDPFILDRNLYFYISENGIIKSKQSPAEYIIKLLKLDRPSRNYLREKRFIRQSMKEINDKIIKLMESFKLKLKENIPRKKLIVEFNKIEKLYKMKEKLEHTFFL